MLWLKIFFTNTTHRILLLWNLINMAPRWVAKIVKVCFVNPASFIFLFCLLVELIYLRLGGRVFPSFRVPRVNGGCRWCEIKIIISCINYLLHNLKGFQLRRCPIWASNDVWAGVGRNRQFCYLRGPSVNFVPSLVPAVEDPVKYRRLAISFKNKKSQPTHMSGLVNNKVRPVVGA